MGAILEEYLVWNLRPLFSKLQSCPNILRRLSVTPDGSNILSNLDHLKNLYFVYVFKEMCGDWANVI